MAGARASDAQRILRAHGPGSVVGAVLDGGPLRLGRHAHALGVGARAARRRARGRAARDRPRAVAGDDRALPRRVPAAALDARDARGGRVPGLVRKLLGEAGIEVDDDELERFLEAEHAAWQPARMLASTTHALLEALRERGLKIGLVSNALDPPGLLHRDLARDGRRRAARRTRSSRRRSGWRKPHPAIFERALEALGVEPERDALRRRHARDRHRRRRGSRHAHVPGAVVPRRRGRGGAGAGLPGVHADGRADDCRRLASATPLSQAENAPSVKSCGGRNAVTHNAGR